MGHWRLAAGVGLVALAGIASAIGQSASSSKSISSGGVSTSAASTPRTYTPTVQAQASAPAPVTIIHEVTVRQHGSELRGVLQIATTRAGRVVGSSGG